MEVPSGELYFLVYLLGLENFSWDISWIIVLAMVRNRIISEWGRLTNYQNYVPLILCVVLLLLLEFPLISCSELF